MSHDDGDVIHSRKLVPGVTLTAAESVLAILTHHHNERERELKELRQQQQQTVPPALLSPLRSILASDDSMIGIEKSILQSLLEALEDH